MPESQKTAESIGEMQNRLNRCLDELIDLLDEAAPEDRGPIFARIDAVHREMSTLVGIVIDAKKPEFKALLKKAADAESAVEAARKRLVDVAKALKVVDELVSALVKVATLVG